MQNSSSIKIINAVSEEQLVDVRNLINEFVKWHLKRHLEDRELINEYFDSKDFEEELTSLPGKYAMPKGRLLLALCNDQPAGCVALHQIDDHSCEMKRMFVYPEFHGKGIGFALAKAIIDEAKKIGYSSMKLDTSMRQVEAQKLYHSFGFRNTEAYHELPEKLKNWLVFMELEL
jgi:GNAT superfamily N-acetyltransferase